jgi:hypothetical protein
MSDTCTFWIAIHGDDGMHLIAEIPGMDGGKCSDGWFEFRDDSVNFGGEEPLQRIAQAHKATFYGWHGAGSSYTSGMFCGRDGEYFHCPTYGHSDLVQGMGHPIVTLDDDGEIVGFRLKKAQDCLDTLRRLLEMRSEDER